MLFISIILLSWWKILNLGHNKVLNNFSLFNIFVFFEAIKAHVKITLLASVIFQVVDSIGMTSLALVVIIVRSFFKQLMATRTYQNILWSLFYHL